MFFYSRVCLRVDLLLMVYQSTTYRGSCSAHSQKTSQCITVVDITTGFLFQNNKKLRESMRDSSSLQLNNQCNYQDRTTVSSSRCLCQCLGFLPPLFVTFKLEEKKQRGMKTCLMLFTLTPDWSVALFLWQ